MVTAVPCCPAVRRKAFFLSPDCDCRCGCLTAEILSPLALYPGHFRSQVTQNQVKLKEGNTRSSGVCSKSPWRRGAVLKCFVIGCRRLSQLDNYYQQWNVLQVRLPSPQHWWGQNCFFFFCNENTDFFSFVLLIS